MAELDHRLLRWTVEHRTEWLDPVFVLLTWVGSWGVVWVAIACVYWLLTRRPYLPLLVVGATAFGEVTNYGLKLAFDRPRPPERYEDFETLVGAPTSPAFPSGHAMTAFLGATLIAFSRARWAPWLYALAALVAWSRVYVGVHYPADVLAGAVYGTALAFAIRGLRRLLGGPRRSRPEPRPG